MDWQHKNIANRYRAGDRKILLFFIVLLTGSTPFCHSPYICSMSRKGNCYDNAPIESFWGKLKQEWLYHQRFKTRAQARDAVFEYIEVFYNRQRLHSTLGYQIPMNLLKAT